MAYFSQKPACVRFPLQMQKVADHIHTLRKPFRYDGTEYEVRVYGAQRSNGTWEGWLEFHPTDGGVILRTGQETSQPTRRTVEYWAGGLEPIYVEGAFTRARRPGQHE